LKIENYSKLYTLPLTDRAVRITIMKKTIIFLLATFIFSCKSVPENQQITIASGGGVTGVWHEYTLKADGQILHKASNVDTAEVVKTISKSKAKGFFKQIEALKLQEKPEGEAGNLTHYVQFSERKKFSRKVQWADNKAPTDSVKTFYDGFMELLK
jgi:hypothetical protein